MLENILLILFILILAAKIAGSFFDKIGLDSTIGELLVGIVLGPSMLNLIAPQSIEQFAIIGSVLILFIAGIRGDDIEQIYNDKHAWAMGITLLIATGAVMSAFFYFGAGAFGLSFSLLQAIVMGLAFSVIDLGVPAKIFISKQLISTPVGKVALRAAVINVVAGLTLFTVASVLFHMNVWEVLVKVSAVALFMGAIIGLMYFLARISRFVVRLHIDEAEFSLAIVLVLFLAYITEQLGFSSVLGAFLAGQIIGRMPFADTKSFSDKVKSISFGLFIPLFFVWFGLGINVYEIVTYLGIAAVAFVLYCIMRFGITYIFVRHYKLSSPALIASSMLSVDVESLVILMVATRLGILSSQVPLLIFAPSVLFSTFLIVVLVAVLWKGKGTSHIKRASA